MLHRWPEVVILQDCAWTMDTEVKICAGRQRQCSRAGRCLTTPIAVLMVTPNERQDLQKAQKR